MKQAIGFAAVAACGLASTAGATVLYEDISYWLPNGVTLINPSTPPTNAYVKIQETVYDHVQGRQILDGQFQIGAINGPAVPAVPFELYCYSITNMNYGNSPITPGGNGVSGFNIPNFAGVPQLGIWAPNAANTRWEPGAGNTPIPANWEWDIDADADTSNGDGVGILLGQTFDSFCFAVPAGTQHGFIPNAWVHSWTGEQPGGGQIDLVYGVVSGPIPAPGALALLGLGGLVIGRRRR
jgi:MYXO-CTERM domain-containing protein